MQNINTNINIDTDRQLSDSVTYWSRFWLSIWHYMCFSEQSVAHCDSPVVAKINTYANTHNNFCLHFSCFTFHLEKVEELNTACTSQYIANTLCNFKKI